MSKSNVPYTSAALAKLRELFEDRMGRKLLVSTDFDKASMFITDTIKEHVSGSTLKRIWGYVEAPECVRVSTLNMIARVVGYSDWPSYELAFDSGLPDSDYLTEANIDVDTLPIGSLVSVYWLPDRKCVFKYLGEHRFVIIEAHNAKLLTGDLCDISVFVCGESLILTNLTRGAVNLGVYVAGRQHGIIQLETE